MTAHCYDWPRPSVTTDIVLLAGREAGLSVLLVRRKGEPFAGQWALPGGFLDEGETLQACAARELKEETGVVAPDLTLVGAYGDPGRDPRGWTVSIAFRARVDSEDVTPVAGDDAAEVGWFAVDSLPGLAFDHGRIVADAIRAG